MLVYKKFVAVHAHMATGCQGFHVSDERPDTQCGKSIVVIVATAHQQGKIILPDHVQEGGVMRHGMRLTVLKSTIVLCVIREIESDIVV